MSTELQKQRAAEDFTVSCGRERGLGTVDFIAGAIWAISQFESKEEK